jgi:hypothetical protein
MFEPCAKHNPGASASLHSNLTTLREQRIGHAGCRTLHNFFMRQLNPSRIDRRSMPVASKRLDLLVFRPQRSAKNPRNGGDRHDSVATRLKFAARPDISGRFSAPYM